MYNYILIFISDLIKYLKRCDICMYQSAIRLKGDLIFSLQSEKKHNYQLKKIAKHSMTRVIHAIQSICINCTNFLIRLPYENFDTITNYNIFKIFSDYDGALLDKKIARKLNNQYKKYKIDIIMAFVQK